MAAALVGAPNFTPTTNFRRMNFLTPNTYYLTRELATTAGNA